MGSLRGRSSQVRLASSPDESGALPPKARRPAQPATTHSTPAQAALQIAQAVNH
jgi:hypothetical protein